MSRRRDSCTKESASVVKARGRVNTKPGGLANVLLGPQPTSYLSLSLSLSLSLTLSLTLSFLFILLSPLSVLHSALYRCRWDTDANEIWASIFLTE